MDFDNLTNITALEKTWLVFIAPNQSEDRVFIAYKIDTIGT